MVASLEQIVMLTTLSPSPNTVIIYVDNPHKMFKVNRAGLSTSPLLSKLLSHHPQNGWYIMSPMLSSIDANDFQPIGEYIGRREYHPNILDDGTVHVRLQGDLTPEMLRHQVVRCGTIYRIAQMLEMPGLQDLAFRKLKALAPQYQPLEILTVIELLFEIGDLEIRQYLMKHVADHYWNFVLAETEKMVKVMSGNEKLARGVFGMLSGADDKVKIEEKGNDNMLAEHKEGAKVEGIGEDGNLDSIKDKGKSRQSITASELDNFHTKPTSDFAKAEQDVPPANSSTNTNKRNNDENKINEEGHSQAEKDMLRIAIRRSNDEEMSAGQKRFSYVEDEEEEEEEEEEDWMQLVKKQEEIFEAY